MTESRRPGAALVSLINDTFGPRPAPPALTLVDRLDLITDAVTDVQSTEDANGGRLEEIAAAAETNGTALADILAVLEDIRDLLTAITDRGETDE